MEHHSNGEEEYNFLSQLPITEEEMQILAENGFDDLQSIRFLDLTTLNQLGINNPNQVLEAVQAICQEYEYEGEAVEQGEIFNIEVKQQKQITQQLIVQTLQQQQSKMSNSAAAQKNKTMKGQMLEQTLLKLTHLHLNNKRIQRIGEEMESHCKSLKVLYLFDNLITEIDGLGKLKNLIQLSLYNNQIAKMEGFEGLTSLRKLYLEKNRIAVLEGLNNCRELEELYLSQQEIQTDFTFDEYSLAAIAGSIKYLDISDSRVTETRPLYYLEKLEVLILKKNRIIDFEEQICPLLQTMSALKQLDLSENPVNAIQKYRDQIIILTGNRLQEIDNKKVTQQERTYLMQLVQRKQRHAIGTPGDKREEKKQGQFEIYGKNKVLHQAAENFQLTGGNNMGTGGGEEEETQNQFYSPLDDLKVHHVLKQRTNISNHSYQNTANLKKRSVNLNANNDFTTAGVSHMATKHVPAALLKR